MSAQRHAIMSLIASIESQLHALKQIAAVDPQTGFAPSVQAQPQQQRYTSPEEDAYIAEQFQLQQQAQQQQMVARQPTPRPYLGNPPPVNYPQQQPQAGQPSFRGAPNEQAVQRLMMAAMGGGLDNGNG